MSKIGILRTIQDKKQGGLILSNTIDETVAVVKKGKNKRYVNQSIRSTVQDMVINDESYIIESYIPLNVERFIIFLSAESGSGKTLLTSIYIEQYHKHFRDKPMYYLCATKIEDDINLKNIKDLQQLDTESLEEYNVEDFADSLVVVDDADFHTDHKKIMKFMNKLVETGRKFGVSIIYASHIHSKLSESPIYKEVSIYVTFPNALINNRMIDNNLKIPQNIIEELKNEPLAYIAFNKIYRTVITDRLIKKY